MLPFLFKKMYNWLCMKEIAQNILKKLEKNGYQAYIVGGFIRDYILNITSMDVDIITSATPKEIKSIFKDIILPREDYGALVLYIQDKKFEIMTFRKDIKYESNRKPSKIEYISSLFEDLKRRDFTMNTLCMNSKGEIIDLLEGKKDIEKRVIKAVFKDIDKELTEDPLRILRAIRFATVLNFDIEENLSKSILRNKSYLKKLSYDRKRKELDLIFLSENVKRGIDLLTYFGIDVELEIYNLKDIKVSKDLLFTWALLDKSENYRFSKIEEQFIAKVNKYINKDIFDKKTIYEMGLYLTTLMAEYKGIKKDEVFKIHSKLKIRSRKDIDYNFEKINYLKEKVKFIIEEVENLIINDEIENDYQKINEYIISKYGGEYER